MWQFITDHPGDFVALLSLALTALGGLVGGIAGLVRWLQAQSERRIDQKIKLLAQGQNEQSERLENEIKLSNMLYETIEEQLNRAREIETALRDRLASVEAEFAAQGDALRKAHALVLKLEYRLNTCKQALAESEAKHTETLQAYQEQQQQVADLSRKVHAYWLEIQRQSRKHEDDRHRLAEYDERAYEETAPLGTLPNATDTTD